MKDGLEMKITACQGTKKLEITASIVLWRITDTRTIPTQTENVAVSFGLRARFDCALGCYSGAV